MGFKDIFNKGLDAIKSGANAAKEAAKEKKESMKEFDMLKTKSEHIGPMQIYVKNNEDAQIGKENLILNMCANVNVEQAKLINEIIPVAETIINVKTAKESKTEKEYIFVTTNVKLWILNRNEYITYAFSDIRNFEIVSKGLLSQSVKFNDNAWVIAGNEEEIKSLGEILLREDARAITVDAKTKYLCGVVPKKQLLNGNMKGVSIGDNKQIVLHNNPDNKVISLNDIAYVQLLMNDSVVLVKGKPGVDQGNMVSTPLEARKMSVKVVLGMGEYVIETMVSGLMNKSYKREDSTYINNYEYSKKVVDTLVELVEENRKSGNVVTPASSQSENPNIQASTAPIQNSTSVNGQPSVGQVNNEVVKNASIPNASSVFGASTTVVDNKDDGEDEVFTL